MFKAKNQCDICNSINPIDEHHIQSVSKGGTNEYSNKIKVCPTCHRKIHEGLITIEGWFMTSIGRQLIFREDITSVTGVTPEVYLIR